MSARAFPLLKQSAWSWLRKPNRQVDLPGAQCMRSDLFSLHLWLDPFTHRLQKHSTSIARVTCSHACNNSEKYYKEISFPPSLPRILFHWTLLCFKSGWTSKQRQNDSSGLMKYDEIDNLETDFWKRSSSCTNQICINHLDPFVVKRTWVKVLLLTSKRWNTLSFLAFF